MVLTKVVSAISSDFELSEITASKMTLMGQRELADELEPEGAVSLTRCGFLNFILTITAFPLLRRLTEPCY